MSGLGGRSLRDYECALHDRDTWWATVYTRNCHLKAGTPVVKHCAKGAEEAESVLQGYTYGALFITFNADGDPRKAGVYFKAINGDIINTFSIVKTRPLK